MWRDEINQKIEKFKRMKRHTDMKEVNENHVFDEEKSVKWNREQVIIHNEKVHEDNDNKRREYYNFKNEIIKLQKEQIKSENPWVNENQIDFVFNSEFVYDYYDYELYCRIDDIINFIHDFNKK